MRSAFLGTNKQQIPCWGLATGTSLIHADHILRGEMWHRSTTESGGEALAAEVYESGRVEPLTTLNSYSRVFAQACPLIRKAFFS